MQMEDIQDANQDEVLEEAKTDYNEFLGNLILYQLPFLTYPVFELTHYIITAYKIRTDFGSQYSR